MDRWRRSRVVIVGLLIAGLLLMSEEVEQSQGVVLTCAIVTQNTLGCLPFVRGRGSKAPRYSSCCSGIRFLDRVAAMNVRHRRKICNCLERGARAYKPNRRAFAALPRACGATFSYSLSRNCNKIR